MRLLIIITLMSLILLPACTLTKQQRTDNKIIRKMEKFRQQHPESFSKATIETVRIDTLIKEVRIEGETKVDTLTIEKEIEKYLIDTVQVTRFIDRFLEVASDSVKVDTLDIHLDMYGAGISYSLTRDSARIIKEQDVTTVDISKTVTVNKIPFYIWIIIVLLSAALVFAIIRR